mgnify:FL=1
MKQPINFYCDHLIELLNIDEGRISGSIRQRLLSQLGVLYLRSECPEMFPPIYKNHNRQNTDHQGVILVGEGLNYWVEKAPLQKRPALINHYLEQCRRMDLPSMLENQMSMDRIIKRLAKTLPKGDQEAFIKQAQAKFERPK